MKPSPQRRERQRPQGFTTEPAGLWLQKAFGKRFWEAPSSSSAFPKHQQPVFSILPGGNSRQRMLKPTASIRDLICPPRKHHRHRAPRPTRDMLRVKATSRRCGLESPSPLTRSISQPRERPASPSPGLPESPFDYVPAPLPGCSCAAKRVLRVQSRRQLCAGQNY